MQFRRTEQIRGNKSNIFNIFRQN